MSYREELRRFHVDYLTRLMSEARGNINRAARLADVSRTRLRHWLAELDMLKRHRL